MQIEVGKEMHWHRHEGNYGFLAIYRVRVEKIGKKIKISVPKMNGNRRITYVNPESLKPISNEQTKTDRGSQ